MVNIFLQLKNFDTGKKIVPICVFVLSALCSRFFIKPYIAEEYYQMASMGFTVLSTLLIPPFILKMLYGQSNFKEVSVLVIPVLLGLLTPIAANLFISGYFTDGETYRIFVYVVTFSVFVASLFLCQYLKK